MNTSLAMLRKVCFVLILAIAGCGDDGPTTSPTSTVTRPLVPTSTFPEGTVLSIVSGAGGAAVANAEVVVARTTYRTNGNGRVTLSTGVNRNVNLSVIAEGFLERRTLLRTADQTRFTLWPREHESGITETGTRDLVYGGIDGMVRGMIRIDPRVSEAYVVVSEQIRRDARAMRVVNDAADSITDATRGEMRFIVANEAPPDAVVFDFVVDPNELVDAVAQVTRRFRGFAIIGGSAVFDSIDRLRTSTTYHELGHLYGFSHTNGTKDIMNTFRRRGTVESFSIREALAMRLLLQRPPRNEFPDNDRAVTDARTLSAGPYWEDVIRCQH